MLNGQEIETIVNDAEVDMEEIRGSRERVEVSDVDPVRSRHRFELDCHGRVTGAERANPGEHEFSPTDDPVSYFATKESDSELLGRLSTRRNA